MRDRALCVLGLGALSVAVGAAPAGVREQAPPAPPPEPIHGAPPAPPSGPDLPFNAYASAAGPGVPIANGHLYTLNMGTGAMTDLGLPVSNGVPLAWDPMGGRLLGYGGVAQSFGPPTGATYDLTTFPGVRLANTPVGGDEAGLARDPTTGKVYVLAYYQRDVALYEVNSNTGAERFIGYQWGVSASSLAINSRGEAFATQVEEEKSLYRVNLSSGALTLVGPLNLSLSGDHTQAMCFDATDTLWLITGGTIGTPARLYTINTTTGQSTEVRFLGVSGWYIGLAILP